MKKVKIIFISICCILCVCGCKNNKNGNLSYKDEKQIEEKIKINLENILKETDLTSSNPFDYTKNEYYQNIVSLGKDAVSVLENMYKNKELSGVNAYLSSLAIEDITDCDLNEKYNLDWSTAEEFYTLWKDHNCSFKK